MTTRPLSPHIQALIEKAKANHAAQQLAKQAAQQASEQSDPEPATATRQAASQAADAVAPAVATPLATAALELASQSVHTASRITLNKEQLAAIEFGLQGKSFCLIGAAGTGKTTVTQELITLLQQAAHVSPLREATKHLVKDNPGIVICGFTNKAVNNIRKKLPAHLQRHCITIHKLLEYAPNYYEVPDPTSSVGGLRTTMRFEPSMNGANPLPHISTIIFEEASMIGTELYGEVIAALPNPARTQIIFLGDLNQIPPVFGPSILGFKLAELPTVELTHVYRQALLSPIISLATAVRLNRFNFNEEEESTGYTVAGNTCYFTEKLTQDADSHGKLTIHPWKRRVSSESAQLFMKSFLPKMIDEGTYNPEADMILCPFNKAFGTLELNKIIATHLAKQRNNGTGELVYEVIARYVKSYWAVGDRVLVDRHEAIITKITRTAGYAGKLPRTESKTLDRWGFDPESDTPSHELTPDEILNALDGLAQDDEGKNLASHTIHVLIPDTGETRTLNTAGEINTMLFSYALTIHKSQGSEWQRVFLFLHHSHATMLSRELVYTGITRAKQELYIICEGDIAPNINSIKRAATRPVIPGTLLSEKIDFFRGKAASMRSMSETD